MSNNKQSSSVEWLIEIDKSRLITIEEWQKAYDNYSPEQYYNKKFGGNNEQQTKYETIHGRTINSSI